ncbi:MAG: exo-alpha-sialidase [Balneolales bacterium]
MLPNRNFANVLNPVIKQPRGYNIPLIDLANETHRQVIVDKETGQYLGHPTSVLLEDGKTIITVYPRGHGRGAILMKKSTDGGLTWSDRLPTPENWATSQETPTIHRVVDPKGKRRLILFSGLYPVRMAVSEDDGETWSSLEPIGDFGGIVVMSDFIRLKDGSYMAFFHDDGRFIEGPYAHWGDDGITGGGERGDFVVYKTRSSDGGLTWSAPVVVVTDPQAHLCEPGVIRSPDGKQLAMLLRENSRQFNSFVTFSNDEGTTWSKPVELPGSLTGDRHQAIYNHDGRLFISFRDTTHESPTVGDWVAWVGRYEDIVNSNSQGQYRVRLMENHRGSDCAYPALELLTDGTIVATTYGHWKSGEEPFIANVRLKLGELDKKMENL